MRARIKAEQVTGRDLKPGDLFSTAPQDYWDHALDHGSCGECVYIRTNESAEHFGDVDSTVYRITIEHEA